MIRASTALTVTKARQSGAHSPAMMGIPAKRRAFGQPTCLASPATTMATYAKATQRETTPIVSVGHRAPRLGRQELLHSFSARTLHSERQRSKTFLNAVAIGSTPAPEPTTPRATARNMDS